MVLVASVHVKPILTVTSFHTAWVGLVLRLAWNENVSYSAASLGSDDDICKLYMPSPTNIQLGLKVAALVELLTFTS